MNRAAPLVLATTFVVGFVGLSAAPASAHDAWCGHSRGGHYHLAKGETVQYERGKNNGRLHRHVVTVATLRGYRTALIDCPAHR